MEKRFWKVWDTQISKSICEANFAWIFTYYWNGVNSSGYLDNRIVILS